MRMKYFLHLSREHETLPAAEAVALLKPKEHEVIGNYLFFDNSPAAKILCKRLAYSRGLYELLFISPQKDLFTHMKKFDWNKIYKKSFCVRLHENPKEIEVLKVADVIWHSVKNPKVDLDNPETLIEFFFVKNKCIVGKKIEKISPNLQEKKLNHPTCLDTKLARCIINLTGVEKGAVTDPFCGVGGVLMEAAVIGLKPIGYDISDVMVEASKKNLAHIGFPKIIVERRDSTKLKSKMDYIATDPPYGKNSATKNIDGLYDAFLKTLHLILRKRAVIVFPHWSKYKKLIKKHKLRLIGEYRVYVHQSMTRVVVIVEKS
jgi:tRNA (guanine10-N2)-dimethyltransferase